MSAEIINFYQTIVFLYSCNSIFLFIFPGGLWKQLQNGFDNKNFALSFDENEIININWNGMEGSEIAKHRLNLVDSSQ